MGQVLASSPCGFESAAMRVAGCFGASPNGFRAVLRSLFFTRSSRRGVSSRGPQRPTRGGAKNCSQRNEIDSNSDFSFLFCLRVAKTLPHTHAVNKKMRIKIPLHITYPRALFSAPPRVERTGASEDAPPRAPRENQLFSCSLPAAINIRKKRTQHDASCCETEPSS